MRRHRIVHLGGLAEKSHLSLYRKTREHFEIRQLAILTLTHHHPPHVGAVAPGEHVQHRAYDTKTFNECSGSSTEGEGSADVAP